MPTMPSQAISGTLVHFPVHKKFKFSDRSLSSKRPPGYYFDELLPGFGIRQGKRRVCFICVREGRRKKIGLWPAITLSDARNRAREYLASLDPSAPLQRRVSYSLAIEEYLRQHTGRPRTVQEYERLLKRFRIDLALQDIRIQHVLKKTDALQHVPTERLHLHTAYRAFFNWCVPRYLNSSPMAGLQSPSKSNKRDRVLTYDELARIWRAAGTMGGFGCIIQLCILTGQRRGELSKKSGHAFLNSCLIISAALAKNRREHTLPLSAISTKLLVASTERTINWGHRKADLDKLSGVTGWVIHDLRRTWATHCAELGVAPHVIERVLNHVTGQGSDLSRIYNRHQYLQEMRSSLELYENTLREKGVIS